MALSIPFYAYTTSRFGETAGRTSPHRGHDVAPGGLAFPSWVTGVVVVAGSQSCLGNRVVVQNDADGYYIGVSHLASINVSVGQRVGVGTVLGVIGNTGSCSAGRHAHITVSSSSPYPESGAVQDPVAYANGATTAGGGGYTPISNGLGYGLSYEAQVSLQRAMSHVGRYAGPHDGAFGTTCVSAMQQWLVDLGYLTFDYPIDGEPGPEYGRGLQRLAAAKGGYNGDIDGEPGAKTSAALIYWAEEVVIKNGGGTSTIWAFGLDMETQRKLQAVLRLIGLYGGEVDGVFGPRTVAAMQEALRRWGYLPADYGVDGNPGVLYGVALQKLAAQWGFGGGWDGVIGADTCTALRKWADWVLAGSPPLDGGNPTPAPEPEPEPEPVNDGRWPTGGAFGIDIASPQRDLDLVKAKAEGCQFVIIKMGGLNVTPQYVAPFYKAQVDRARAAGLPVGHYYLIGLGQTPEQQAAFFVANLYDFDVEHDVLALDNEKLDSNGTKWTDDAASRFLAEVIRLTGIAPERVWHYAGAHDYRSLKPWDSLIAVGGKFWWAAYGTNSGRREFDPADDLAGAIPEAHVHQFSSLVALAGYKLDGNWSKYKVGVLFAKGTVVTPDPDPEPEPEPEPDPDTAAKLAQFDARLKLAEDGVAGLRESFDELRSELTD